MKQGNVGPHRGAETRGLPVGTGACTPDLGADQTSALRPLPWKLSRPEECRMRWLSSGRPNGRGKVDRCMDSLTHGLHNCVRGPSTDPGVQEPSGSFQVHHFPIPHQSPPRSPCSEEGQDCPELSPWLLLGQVPCHPRWQGTLGQSPKAWAPSSLRASPPPPQPHPTEGKSVQSGMQGHEILL